MAECAVATAIGSEVILACKCARYRLTSDPRVVLMQHTINATAQSMQDIDHVYLSSRGRRKKIYYQLSSGWEREREIRCRNREAVWQAAEEPITKSGFAGYNYCSLPYGGQAAANFSSRAPTSRNGSCSALLYATAARKDTRPPRYYQLQYPHNPTYLQSHTSASLFITQI